MTSKLDLPGDSFFVHLTRASSHTRYVLIALACLLLAACGGGGGSESGDNSNVSMSLSQSVVSVSAMTTQPAPTAGVQVYVANLQPNQKVYVGPKFTDKGIVGASVIPSSTLPATISIQFKTPVSLGPGTYDDTVTIYVCFDQGCSQPLSNSPQTVQVQYTVTKSTFELNSLNPTSAYVGAQALSLTVNGSTFTPQSSVLWNGTSIPTSYLSSSQLTASVPEADVATAGSATIAVSDPEYGTSNTETFTVNASPLTLASISPTSINAGSPAFTLTLTGTSFTTQSTILWNNNSVTSTFVSASQLIAQVPAPDIATTGSATVSVSDPVYGNSNAEIFTITPPSLILERISPQNVTVGGPPFVLTVLGTAFSGTSVVQWNGTALATKLISSNELVAQVPASDIVTAGAASVLVSDPDSPPGKTSAQTINVVPVSVDAVASQMNPAHTGAVTFASVSFPSAPAWSVDVGGTASYALIADGKVVVTVDLSGDNSEVLALDQATGKTVWGPIMFGGIATAAYDNGKVFVLSGADGAQATLEALDMSTGALAWSTVLTGRYVFSGLPTATDGTVYMVAEGTMSAVDEATGAVLWTQGVGGTSPSPAVTADGVYTAYSCQTMDLRPATGEVIWQSSPTCSGGGGAMPVVANQLVYSNDTLSGFGGDVFDAETGASDGTYAADAMPVLTATMGYFLQSGTLRGVMLSNNAVQWSFAGDGTLVSAPIVVNQYVFIGSRSGNLYALDGATGSQVWSVNLGAAIGAGANTLLFSGLAAGDGLLVVPSGTTVTAYQLSTNP